MSTGTWARRSTAAVAAAGAVALAAAGGATAAIGHHDRATEQQIVAGTRWDGVHWGDDTTKEGPKARDTAGVWHADHDNGSAWNIEHATGAQDVWKMKPSRLDGSGVTVALIDTGISPVPGLDAPGKVINGPDFSFEGQDPSSAQLDGYGHGTHMAGIIAGRDTNTPAGHENDAHYFAGMAPGASLLNVKVATADGGVDVTQVIAGVDWVVAHRNDNGMNVRVINLSYGTDSTQAAAIDPLARAVENAWRHGIVVVVAAGNEGNGVDRLTMPATDPYVIAVGASDHHGTADTKDDTLTDFTNGGTLARHADLLAPGKSVVSLRDPGSLVDDDHSEGLIPGDTAGRFFRGSGTSQATAVVSGAVADLLEQRPTLTPDQVKSLLTRTGTPLTAANMVMTASSLAPLLNLKAAAQATTPTPAQAAQSYRTASGLGSLEASRGGNHVVDPLTGASLSGEQDIFGTPWEPVAWASAEDSDTIWADDIWNGRRWSGSSWDGNAWDGSAWTGRRWSDTSWSGRRWSGSDWSGRRWSDASWSGRRWSGDGWTLDTM